MLNILFWGPQCTALWAEEIIIPAFEALPKDAWSVRYCLPKKSENLTGVTGEDLRRIKIGFPRADVSLIEGLPFSVFHQGAGHDVVDGLTRFFGDYRPDIVVVRTEGHVYLRKIFPAACILTAGEAVNMPWLGYWSFQLTRQENFWGSAFIERYWRDILVKSRPSPEALDNFRGFRTSGGLDPEAAEKLHRSFERLRQAFSRIYLFPADFTREDGRYLNYTIAGQRFSNNADALHYLLDASGADTAFLVVTHPGDGGGAQPSPIYTLFQGNPRVLTREKAALPEAAFQTGVLAGLVDGLIVRNSKAYWHALFHEKAILCLGPQAISFATDTTLFEPFADAAGPKVSATDAGKLLYWHATRQRLNKRCPEKLDHILQRFLRFDRSDTPGDMPADFYEWSNDDGYARDFARRNPRLV
ncbi:hypothetical protein [Eilatimonas milleporae]|uniref:Uncharacterized protein n=1 Tax=Eilatimonas milleporae TaxID=911205 RepID=A0A3M0C7U2_9PROT|nr:hypothetical protein [Eilatimonas milleporae]RMB04777.1 hypothetical protein BXY39_2341 [Eilatimonas milleporae]